MSNNVVIIPLPAWCREYPQLCWPLHPPIFQDGAPTRADIELAIELIEALSPEGRAWYAIALAGLRRRVGEAT